MKKIDQLDLFITTDKSNLYGLADKDQKVLIPNDYLYIDYAFNEYFVAYKEGQGLGVIDKAGKVIIDFEYNVLSKIGDKNLLKGVKMGTSGDVTTVFSEKMEKLTTLSDVKISIFNDYIEVYNNKEKLFINNNGEVKESKELFTNNKLFAAEENGKWGYENLNGEIKVKCQYDFVLEFNRFGFAGIKKDNKWGIIDENGNIVLEPIFEFEENGENAEFLGKYYKNFKENNEIYYTDEITETGEGM